VVREVCLGASPMGASLIIGVVHLGDWNLSSMALRRCNAAAQRRQASPTPNPRYVASSVVHRGPLVVLSLSGGGWCAGASEHGAPAGAPP
jgi:hypothetical protein